MNFLSLSAYTLIASALFLTRVQAEEAADRTPLPFWNPNLPIEQRVNDLISRLTVEEKISQTMMASAAIPRLGIPKYDWWNEGLHGVARNGVATVFPQAIALAATWDLALHEQIADVISTEARAKNNELLRKTGGASDRYQGLTIWSPNINIFRDPRWGRGQETYGEDPFLTSRFAVSFIHGLQGTNAEYLKTVATVKHYAVHSGPEPSRHRFDAVVSSRDLHETYLPAFEAGIREGGAWSLMSAYNAVDGVPAPGNHLLLGDILRRDWGFKGAVVGDVDTVADMWHEGAHEYAKSAAEASALAVKAGNDLCSGTTYEALPEALQRGLLAEADIDTALRRLFYLRFKLGQFDAADRVPYRNIPISENNSPAHDELALRAAQESLVLLKNDGTLPWNPKSLQTVAVLGPTANDESTLLGNYFGTPSRKVTLAKAIKSRFESEGVQVLTEPAVPLVKGFRMNGKPFAPGVLFTDSQRQQPGLKADVFIVEQQNPKKPIVEGTLTTNRVDTQIDLQWSEAQPINGIAITNSAIRWTGVLVPPTSGEYVLGLVVEGAVRLYIDDALTIDSWKKYPERPLSTAIKLTAGKAYNVRLEYVQLTPKGRIQFGWIAPGTDDTFERAMTAARKADHIILALGLTPDLEGEEMSVNAEGFKGGDKLSVQLPATQKELLEKVCALHKPTVVILTTGSALSFDVQKPNAILLCWYYGQRGGDAVADALLGEVNPAGRLPITFYRNDSDLPPFESYAMTNRTYRYFTGKPLYPFGYGLSYTRFDYKKLALAKKSVRAEDSIDVTVTVKNTGKRDGDEVVQLYGRAVHPPVPMPLKQLVGFQRVTTKVGETKTINIAVPAKLLRRWDDASRSYVVDPGEYQITAGPASDHPLLKANFDVQK